MPTETNRNAYFRWYYHNVVKKKKGIKPKPIYAVYKGEDFICDGKPNEICRQLNISMKTFYFYLSPTYKKRLKERKKLRKPTIVINLSDDNPSFDDITFYS